MRTTKDIYILADPLYVSSAWCIKCMKGLKDAARKNHVTCRYLTDVRELREKKDKIQVIVLVSVRYEWLESIITETRKMGIKSIVLGAAIEYFANDISGSSLDRRQPMYDMIRCCCENGKKRIASVGNKPEDFNDIRREEIFLDTCHLFHLMPEGKDIFLDTEGIDKCVEDFLDRVEEYDAAICVNDYVAVTLIAEAKNRGVSIPERLFVGGAGNMLIGCYADPEVTTSTLEYEAMGSQAVNIFLILSSDARIGSVRFTLATRTIWRRSLGTQEEGRDGMDEMYIAQAAECVDLSEAPDGKMHIYPDNNSEIERIETCLQQCDEFDYKIISGIIENKSFEMIADESFASTGAVYYRLKKIYAVMDVENRSEFKRKMEKYLSFTHFEKKYSEYFYE